MVHTTSTLALLALAAPAILAIPSHNRHQHLHRRDEVIVTDITTVYHTEYYTEGDPQPATQIAASSSQAPASASSQLPVQLAQVEVPSSASSSAAAASSDPVMAENFVANRPHTTFAKQTSAAVPSVATSLPAVKGSSNSASATASAATAAASSSSTSSGSAGGKKAGLLYNYQTFGSMSAFANEQNSFGWMYSWDMKSFGVSGYEFVPMLHAMSDATNFLNAVPSLVSGGAKYMLGLNEPDMNGVTANQAAQTFVTNMQVPNIAAGGKTQLITPGFSSTDGPNTGINYIKQFMSACKNTQVVSQVCDIHACAVHWYGNAGQDSAFQDFVTQAHSACDGKPIWVTELGLYHSGNGGVSAAQAATNVAAESAFLQSAVKWLEEQTFVERYAYYWVSDGFLLNGSQKSTLGQDYVSAAAA